MTKIKIGIIGLGMAWERLHAPAFARLTDKFEIVAVCDRDGQKAREAAAWMQLPQDAAYTDYHALLSHPGLEAVDAMVPISENDEVAQAVIKSGKHLLTEKPFAASLQAARDLLTLKNRAGVHVMVAENFRYDEENVLIKRLLEEHRIGNPVYFIDHNVTEFQKDMLGDSFAQAQWRQHPDFKGGVLLDSGVHHIARQRFLFGDVLELYATGRPSEVDFAPYACVNALLTFQHHVAGHYSFYMTGHETQAPLTGLRIFGTGGEIYLEDRCCGFVNVSYKDGAHDVLPYTPGQGYFRELENFHAALRLERPIVSTPEKEMGDMTVVFALLESIGQGESVTLNASGASGDYAGTHHADYYSAHGHMERSHAEKTEKTKRHSA